MTNDEAKRNSPPTVDLTARNLHSIYAKGGRVREACRNLVEAMQHADNFGMQVYVTLNDGEPVQVKSIVVETALRISHDDMEVTL